MLCSFMVSWLCVLRSIAISWSSYRQSKRHGSNVVINLVNFYVGVVTYEFSAVPVGLLHLQQVTWGDGAMDWRSFLEILNADCRSWSLPDQPPLLPLSRSVISLCSRKGYWLLSYPQNDHLGEEMVKPPNGPTKIFLLKFEHNLANLPFAGVIKGL